MNVTTGFSGTSKALKAGLVTTVLVAVILSCSEGSTGPNQILEGDPSTGAMTYVVFHHADSLKRPGLQAVGGSVAQAPILAPTTIQGFSDLAMSSVVVNPSYRVSAVPFAPEALPRNALQRFDDVVNYNLPVGFLFKFFGNNYNIVHISSNGFLSFLNTVQDGFKGGSIPNSADAPLNNLIALAWTDLDPSAAGASYSYGTIGSAPNRKFVVQWTNVPEYDLAPTALKTPGVPPGHVTGQIVMSEGTNDITMYTTSLDITSDFHPVTQGIENASGTEAIFAPGRVSAHFSLTNDAIRFAVWTPNQPPVVVAPPTLTVNTDPGVCDAAVNPGTPTVTDDALGTRVVGVRSDGLALDARYPKRQTSISWTATDADGLTSAAAQAINVVDKEIPSIVAPADITIRATGNASHASLAVGQATSIDNCGDVTVAGARSDNAALSAEYPVGVTIVTWTATDASGNVASAAQTITVIGNLAPVISAPAGISVQTDPGVCVAAVSPGAATATDDTEGVSVMGARSDNLALSAAYPKGTTTIVWTAKDAEGLTASASQLVSVSDGQKPSVSAPANVSAGNNPGMASASVAPGAAVVADNCPGVSVSALRSDDAALDAAYPVGKTIITWIATDASGNAASAEQSIVVRDIEAPILTVPSNFSVSSALASGMAVNFTVNASDNVGVTSLSCDRESGSVFPVGSTSVSCVAGDAAGNSTSRMFSVQVIGPQVVVDPPPVVDPDTRIRNLIAHILALHLRNGTANPLVNRLRDALGSGSDHECRRLSDFVVMFTKKWVPLPDAEYSYILGEANGIMSDLGCSQADAASSRTRTDSSHKPGQSDGHDDRGNRDDHGAHGDQRGER